VRNRHADRGVEAVKVPPADGGVTRRAAAHLDLNCEARARALASETGGNERHPQHKSRQQGSVLRTSEAKVALLDGLVADAAG
jgi:hypothetical protein